MSYTRTELLLATVVKFNWLTWWTFFFWLHLNQLGFKNFLGGPNEVCSVLNFLPVITVFLHRYVLQSAKILFVFTFWSWKTIMPYRFYEGTFKYWIYSGLVVTHYKLLYIFSVFKLSDVYISFKMNLLQHFVCSYFFAKFIFIEFNDKILLSESESKNHLIHVKIV